MIGLIKDAVGLVGGQLKSRNKIKEAETNAKVKKIEQTGNWEEKAVDGMAKSWKDELWTLWVLTFMSLCFVPSLQPYIENGIKFLDSLPFWMILIILASASVAFGINLVDRVIKIFSFRK